jgi:hypothetical protein
VPVAQHPGDPRERWQICGTDLKQRLSLGNDVDESAVFEHERVVGAQPNRSFEIELDARPFHGKDVAAVRAALVEAENERISRLSMTMVVTRQHLGRTRHG